MPGIFAMILTLLGLVGSVCFAFAATPTALECARAGRNVGAPRSIAWLIFTGLVLVYLYLVLKFFVVSGIDWVLTATYLVEALSWGTILFYTYFPRRNDYAKLVTPGKMCPDSSGRG